MNDTKADSIWHFSQKPWYFLTLTLLLLAILRGIRYPSSWTYTHFLFNYEFGIVKRGLIGELFYQLGNPYFQSYPFFFIFSFVIFGGNIILLVLLFSEVIKSKNPILLGCTLLFVSSLAVVFLSHTVGYFDHIGLLITLVALRIRGFYRRLFFLFIALPIALLIHEAILILFFPVNFMCLFFSLRREGGRAKLLWLGVLSVICLGLLFVMDGRSLTDAEVDEMYMMMQARVDYPLRKDAFRVLQREARENHERTQDRWSAERLLELRESIMVTAPTVLLLVWLMVLSLRQARFEVYIIILSVLASLSPLLLYVWGWDIHRWNTLAITTSFLMLFVVYHFNNISLPIPHYLLLVFGLMIVLNSMSKIPLFDGYYVKQFPFMEHQSYILDLFRGMVFFR